MPRSFILLATVVSLVSSSSSGQETPSAEFGLEIYPQLYISDADGGNLRRLFPQVTGRSEGAPCLSGDGKLLAFNTSQGTADGKTTETKIVLLNRETGAETELINGARPTLSPRGKRFAFMRPGERSVWVASVNNPEETLTLLDRGGWGPAWSPDGKKLAWVSSGQETNLKVLDIVEGEEWNVFSLDSRGRPEFQAIDSGLTWSPDSRYLVFRGVRKGRTQIVAVDALEERQPVLLREGRRSELGYAFAWHPDGAQILLPMQHSERERMQLHLLTPLQPNAPPVPLQKLPAEIITSDPCYTPDGKQIIFAARVAPPGANGEEEDPS